MRDLARDQHLAVILIASQGLVTIAAAGAAGLDQAVRVAVQETAAGNDIIPAAVRGIGRVLGSASGAGQRQTNDGELCRLEAYFEHGFELIRSLLKA